MIRKINFWLCFLFLPASSYLQETSVLPPSSAIKTELNESDVVVDLRQPRYQNGILFTDQGGVIRSKNLRIQAQTIQYVRRTEDGKEVHRIEAEGNLMMQYHGRVFIGSELEYDFISKSGSIYDATTFASLWYVGGEKILLHPDGSYKTQNAFLTTCENSDSSWDLHAGKLNVMKNNLVEAQKMRLRFFKIPLLWLPSFKINLKKFKEPIFRYTINWDKGGPCASVRYRFYSWRDWALYGRLDYRLKTGFGGAFETEYFPSHKNMTFVTRNYLGTNKLENALDAHRRYRLEGAIRATSRNEKTHTTLTWDKYSDVRMPQDFQSSDFEVNTANRTQLFIHHQEDELIASLKARPRINAFESIKQDIPTLFISAHPNMLGRSGIFYSLWGKASYLNFIYSNQLVESSPHIRIPHIQSSRCEIRPLFYRPFHFGPVNITPHLGAEGIFYGTSQDDSAKTVAALLYGGTIEAKAIRDFKTIRHEIQPYLNYQGIGHPTTGPNNHYIFSIQDGYHRINKLQLGIRNLLFSKRSSLPNPRFTIDLYANAFLIDKKFPQMIPKVYILFDWLGPSIELSTLNAWNFWHQVLDFSNTRLQLTVNENAAFAIDIRYRSRYDWRKADHENFMLDVTRSESELLSSPLSDRRLSFLTHSFFRLTPFWECHLQSHHGFLRETQNTNPEIKTQEDHPLRKHLYNEFKIDLFTWLSTNWKLRITYSHTMLDDRVTAGISLVNKGAVKDLLEP